MFLLPSIALGVCFALVLGGRLSRLLDVELRHAWLVFSALGLQLLLFFEVAVGSFETPVHLGSYALLFGFAFANARNLALLPLSLGMALNSIAIVANDGHMPVAPQAWDAAGLSADAHSNVRLGADHVGFLGDVFALPKSFPLTNVFSIGDILIGIGMVGFIVAISMGDSNERALVPSRLVRPLRVVSFRRIAFGKLVSHLGDWLTIAALVGWVYEETQSTAHVAGLMLVRLVPPILGGGVAAAVVDRLPKQRLLVCMECARGVVVAGALVGVLVDVRALAFAAVAVSGVLAAVSAATLRAMVPSLLPDDQLAAGNAGLGLAQDAAMAVGALLAGITLATTHVAVALGVDLVTFAVAITLYWGVRATPAVVREGKPLGSLVAGIRYVVHRRLLLVVIGAFGAATIATGLTNATLPRLLDGEFGLGPGAYGFGLAALAGGLAAGEAVVGFTRVGTTGGRWIGVALLFMSALFLTLAYTQHAPTALLLLAFIGFLDGTTDVLFDTIVQREADPAFYGRIFGLASAFFTTTMMGAVAAAPLVNRLASPHTVIMIGGIALLVSAAVALVGTGSSLAWRSRRGSDRSPGQTTLAAETQT
jgi:Family of unknown function (DUF5317)/Major Facilitator Superfamily